VDRISVFAAELGKFGVQIEERADGFTISGPVRLHGTKVDSHDDHRLAMSLAVAGLAGDSLTTVAGAECARDSFPGFVQTMAAIGADMAWVD
jgi:3-phosphoshikimate 1-carboxyvinyltransferase